MHGFGEWVVPQLEVTMEGGDDEDKRDGEKKIPGCKSNSDRKAGDSRRFDRVGTYEDILISPEKDSWKVPRSSKETIGGVRTTIASVHGKAIAEEEEGALLLR